jgi:hypothetical protein
VFGKSSQPFADRGDANGREVTHGQFDAPMTLLCRVKWFGVCVVCCMVLSLEGAEQPAGDDSLEASFDVAQGLPSESRRVM